MEHFPQGAPHADGQDELCGCGRRSGVLFNTVVVCRLRDEGMRIMRCQEATRPQLHLQI